MNNRTTDGSDKQAKRNHTPFREKKKGRRPEGEGRRNHAGRPGSRARAIFVFVNSHYFEFGGND
jgi:hypothetical protein